MTIAIIFVDQGVQDQEFFYPYYRFLEDGYQVKVITCGEGDIKGKYGIPIPITLTCMDCYDIEKQLLKQCDIIYIPGGWQAPELMRQHNFITNFIFRANEEGKIIASICHGPQVLISAKIVNKRKMTCYKGIKDDLINAGAYYLDEHVVVDDNIVTAPHYNDNPIFMKTLLQVYEGQRIKKLFHESM